jgi:four helix bundle protein
MYDLEGRTLQLAVSVRIFIHSLPKTIAKVEDAKQLARSSGSIGANYIEAYESLSKKDLIMRMRISRKEAKETVFRLNIILKSNDLNLDIQRNCEKLIIEAGEIRNILSAIIKKSV